MPSALDRIDFGPPPSSGKLRALTLAVLVHAMLIAALTWGVSWKRSDTEPSFSAELWSTTVQQAAPPLPAPLTPPTPIPTPQPPATTTPALPPPQAAPTRPLAVPDVDIALEQEKKRKLELQKQQREQEEAQDKRQAAMDAKAEKAAQAKRQADDAKKTEAAALEAKNKAAASAAASAAARASANAAAEQQRKQNLARAMGMAGAQGDESSKGSALVSSGPTAAYKNRLAALFKRNIVFSNVDSIQGNPKAEVQVKVSSTGLIMSARLSKSSGVTAWDEAVLRAVEKTERIPLDENGKVVSDFPVGFGPKD